MDGGSPTDPDRQNKPRILLVEDYPGLVMAFSRVLAPFFDIVGHVADGAEVVSAVSRLRPDVVLLDVNLPDVDGLECCRRVKATPHATTVIMLTAVDDEAVRDRALTLGASAFVAKHSAVDELVSTIQRALTP